MKTFSDTAYLVLLETFAKYLEKKHDLPFDQIELKDIDPEDLMTWREIENMRGVKIGFTIKDRLLRPSLVGVSKKNDNNDQKTAENNKNLNDK